MATHATRNVVVMVPHVMWLLVNAIVLMVLCHPLVLTVSDLKTYKLVLSSESFRNNYHRENVFWGIFATSCEARVAQWWEHSPPTKLAGVQILASTPYVGWVCCWFSPSLREDFLGVPRFFPLLKNQHFQILIQSGTHGHVEKRGKKITTVYNYFE